MNSTQEMDKLWILPPSKLCAGKKNKKTIRSEYVEGRERDKFYLHMALSLSSTHIHTHTYLPDVVDIRIIN